ncbi:Serine/threonine-protein kinase PknB [Rubripirellula obstinata]|uniref:non-specific serine/threonine protein kinase n=1 Tax=Rubripirellula obstinata TaxID=406547 RepID=A0A5B1CS49_9BACT|nr:serine/threonine-protein kinase [Rubripirellula obstinata]KAA1262500.1 Serine/threonine-protein kinase PknB [Rubripirellula obstinata]
MQSIDLTQYDFGDVLGVGTVGSIYLGTHRQTGKRVAIKKLHPAVSQDANIRARFEREMLVLSRLKHPNIIEYFGGGQLDGQLFYIMELVHGGTVKDLLERQGSFAWPVVVELSRQICSALQHAHNHGVIHRDLKPGNLFLTRDGELKLGDFGIARDLHSSDLTSSGMTVGTHAYMSPEQITGDLAISGKADLYALGCCIFEMLTGQKVFDGENFAQLFEQHLKVAPRRLSTLVPSCPPELDDVVNQCLAKDPIDRPFNARSVQGVMFELGESYDLADPKKQADLGIRDTDNEGDVSADEVHTRGRQLLIDQIRSEGFSMAPDISWARLSIIIAGIIATIALFTILNR